MFFYDEANLPWEEKEKIRHEINTYYSKYSGLSIIAHKSLGIDNHYYIYYVENHGFDDFRIFYRLDDLEEEDTIYG